MLFASVLFAADSGQDVFQKGLVKERTEADFRGAIKLYERVVKEHSTDRKLAAQALFRIGECQQALGSPEARAAYERVVREFADQRDSAAEARKRLAALRPVAQPQLIARQVSSGQWLDGYAVPSPDDRYMIHTDWATGDLALRDMSAGTSRHVTDVNYRDGNAEHAVLSPDGRQIAYAWLNYTAGTTELRLLPVAVAASPKIVHQSQETEYLWPAGWTPDGKEILAWRTMRDKTSQLVMVSVEDGSLRILKSFGWRGPDRHTSLSPDGKYVTYSAPAADGIPAHDIFVLAADGSQETKVAESPAIDWSPIWSPDGANILFVSDRTGDVALWSVPVAAGKQSGPPALIKSNIGFIEPLGITRSGKYYYATGSQGRRNVYVTDVDKDGKAAREPVLIAGRFVNSNAGPAWSPDGQYVAYYTFRSPSVDIPGTTVLVIRTLKTGAEREVAMPDLRIPTYAAIVPPRWFPDSRSVLVVSYQPNGPAAGFYKVDIANGHIDLLHTTRGAGPGQTHFSLSSDGKAIYYIDLAPRPGQLMRFDLEDHRETEIRRAGPGENFTSAVATSPDGADVAFGIRSRGTTALYVIPAGVGEPREVYRDSSGLDGRFDLGWSRDSQYLMFVRPETAQAGSQKALWRVSVKGGEPERVGISMEDIFWPQMSPDGRRIAFASRENNTQEVWTLENFLSPVKR